MFSREEIAAWRGEKLCDTDGEKLGSIEEIYLDEETGEPEWLAVKTGLFGGNVSFVPLAGATVEDDEIRVPYDKDHVKDAPNVEADGALSPAEEASLYRHYGLEYSRSRSDAGTGEETADAMTRSEEELNVGTREVESGRVRLRKYVVTEQVTKTVPVRHEEVRLEREPITDANRGEALDGPAISEDEHEVVLHAEEPVVEKRAVPKERVRLETDTVTDEQSVSEELRKERIETDGIDERR